MFLSFVTVQATVAALSASEEKELGGSWIMSLCFSEI
jgi:hypothetical protein